MTIKDLVEIQILELLSSLQLKDHSLHKQVFQNIQLLCPIDLIMVGTLHSRHRPHQHQVYVNLLSFGQGQVIYDGNSSIIVNGTATIGAYKYIPGTYRSPSAYGWAANGTSPGTQSSPNGDMVTPSMSAERVDTTLSIPYNESVINLI